MNHDNQLTATPRHKCCDASNLAADAMVDEELRLCFNIDVTDDEFYKNIAKEFNGPVNIFCKNMNTVFSCEEAKPQLLKS